MLPVIFKYLALAYTTHFSPEGKRDSQQRRVAYHMLHCLMRLEVGRAVIRGDEEGVRLISADL